MAKFDFLRLRQLREGQSRKITQDEVAKILGVSRANYAKKELGQVSTTLDDIEKLTAFYKVSVVAFCVEDIDVTPEEKGGGDMQELINELSRMMVRLNAKLEEKEAKIEELSQKLKNCNKK